MKVKLSFLNYALLCVLFIHSVCFAETIDVQIKGIDDGVRATKQQDYKEAVLFAKREAIERAGVKIKSMTTVKDMVVNSDYIESKAEAALMPGYNIIDIGYSMDGTYQIVLVGKVKSVLTNAIDSKELRYIKSIVDRGDKAKAKSKLFDLMEASKDEAVVAESMCLAIEWNFTDDPIDMYHKLKAYYPSSKYISRAERKFRDPISGARVVKWEDGIIVYDNGHFVDTKTGLMWTTIDNGKDVDWEDAKRYCKSYRGGGYTDWRMPTKKEIKQLNTNIDKLSSKQIIAYKRAYYYVGDRTPKIDLEYRRDPNYHNLKSYERDNSSWYCREVGVYALYRDRWDTPWQRGNKNLSNRVIPVRNTN